VRALLIAIDLPTAAEIGAALQEGWPDVVLLYGDSVEEARATLAREQIDVVLVGGSPSVGGLQLCIDVCEDAHAPVIVVTDRRGLIDPVRAAELGVQDFLWRPISRRAVTRRIRGLLERERATQSVAEQGALEAGELRIDYAARAVTVDGQAVDLNVREYALLYHLARNANSVLAYDTLLAKVWGRRYVGETDVLRVHVERLRLKLGTAPRTGPRIAWRDGLGYAFEHRGRDEAQAS
jgi:two-component system KDP operon response regulator KdpE